jgi:hypothetical protein
MAIAQFFDQVEEDEETTLHEVYIEDYCRYTGPPGTEWQLVDSSSYQFRTSADEVADAIDAVRAGKMTIKAACKANPTFQEVIDREVEFMEDGGDVLPENPDARRLQASHDLPVHSLFESLHCAENRYWIAEDEFNPQAVEALDYPDWATAERGDAGGIGTGYTAGFIRIKKGHDLAELWQWLEKRQAERSTAAKEKTQQGRRKAK